VPLFDGAGVDGAGVIGCGDDEPKPVVLGGVTVREAVVVGGEEPLFAVLLLLASNDQEADQQQQRDTGNPTPHAADVLVTADHRVTQTRIRKTWISHGILLSSGRFVSSQHEENLLAVTAVPSLDSVLLDESSSVPTAAGLFKVPGTSGLETLNR
jgi:hypothetical protein